MMIEKETMNVISTFTIKQNLLILLFSKFKSQMYPKFLSTMTEEDGTKDMAALKKSLVEHGIGMMIASLEINKQMNQIKANPFLIQWQSSMAF